MVTNTVECICSTLSQAGLICEPQEISDAAQKASGQNTLLNKGITGRGYKAFDNDKGATTALDSILRLYNHEDLTGIGVH